MSNAQAKKNVLDIFLEGARKGWTIGVNSILPNVLMAFVIMQFLELSGLLKLIAKIFKPLMGIFGRPGAAVTVLVGGWLSMGGGTGVAAKLYTDGTLTIEHLAIMLPAIYLMGSQVQYMGRILGTANVKTRYYGVMILFSVLNAALSMIVMRILVKIF